MEPAEADLIRAQQCLCSGGGGRHRHHTCQQRRHAFHCHQHRPEQRHTLHRWGRGQACRWTDRVCFDWWTLMSLLGKGMICLSCWTLQLDILFVKKKCVLNWWPWMVILLPIRWAFQMYKIYKDLQRTRDSKWQLRPTFQIVNKVNLRIPPWGCLCVWSRGCVRHPSPSHKPLCLCAVGLPGVLIFSAK